MKLFCSCCTTEVEVSLKPSGHGLKASCALCGQYIKFLNRKERLTVEGGPRPLREDVLAIAQRLRPEDQQWLKEHLMDSVPVAQPSEPEKPKKKAASGFGRPYKNILPPLKK